MIHDQYVFAVFIAGTVIITGFAITMTVFLVIYRKRQTKNLLDQQEMAHNYSKKLLETRIEVQEQSLKLVSLELHDNVAQILSLSCMQIGSLKDKISLGDCETLVEDSLGLIRRVIKNVRLLSHNLSDTMIEMRELSDVVQDEVDRIGSFSRLSFIVSVGELPIIDPQIRLLMFRILQESLQNILKHAEATEVEISIEYAPGTLTMRVADNGIGFDATIANLHPTLGLSNIRHRTDMMNGTFELKSVKDIGTELIIQVPC